VLNEIPESKRTDENVLETEYKYFFEQYWPEYSDEEVKNPLYKIQIHNNTEKTSGMFYGETSAMCEFCNRVHNDNCDFDFDDRLYIKDVVRKIQSNRDLGITLLWRSNGPKANLEYFN
jgi:hypothetical protein